MNPIVTWIGGATLAVALLIGGAATLGNTAIGEPDTVAPPPVPAHEFALVIDRAAFDARLAGETVPQGTAATSAFISTETEEEDPQSAVLMDEPAVANTQPAAGARRVLRRAASTDMTIKRILPIEGPIRYGQWFWDTEGVPPGPLIVTVDLDARVMSVWRGGYEIGATAVMLGTDDHPTPLGTFPILTKERHNVSEKYGNAPMPWTLRLTWDGIAIHGGSEVERGYASHGCIAAPDPFMNRLFSIAKKGDKVVITRGKQLQMGQTLL